MVLRCILLRMTAVGSYIDLSHLNDKPITVEVRESMDWPVGLQLNFVEVADVPKIFIPKLRFTKLAID